MIIPIVVFFGSILFGFALLFLAIRLWQRRRQSGNSDVRKFSQSYGTTGGVLSNYDDDSESEDYSDYSSLSNCSATNEQVVGAKAEMSADLTVSNETSSESSWSYNSSESSPGYSDSSSYTSCSSNSSDSGSSCSSSSSD